MLLFTRKTYYYLIYKIFLNRPESGSWAVSSSTPVGKYLASTPVPMLRNTSMANAIESHRTRQGEMKKLSTMQCSGAARSRAFLLEPEPK